jgi:PAS domain S-box-containing protein
VIVTLLVEMLILFVANQLVVMGVDQDVRDMATAADQMSGLAAEHVERVLDHVRDLQTIAGLEIRARNAGDDDAMRAARIELANAQFGREDGIYGIMAVGADGRGGWNTIEGDHPQENVSGRDYAAAIIAGRAMEAVGTPIVGHVGHRLLVPIGRGIYGGDNRLIGIAIVGIAPEALISVARMMDFGPHDVIAVLRSDGTMLARSDGREVGRRFALSELAAGMSLAAPESHGVGVSPIDGIRRSFVARRIPGTGMIVAVGLGEQARLARGSETRRQLVEWIVLLSFAVLLLGAGAAAALHLHASAIADRRRAETQRERMAMLRELAETVPDLVCLHDADGRVLIAGAASREMLGVEPEAMIGKTFAAFAHTDDLAIALGLGVAAETQPGARTELRLLRRDGSAIWVEVQADLAWHDAPERGEAARVVTCARDITQRRAAEDALRQTREEVDTLLAALPTILYRNIIGPEGTSAAQFVTASVEAVTGFSPAEIAATTNWWLSRIDPAFIPLALAFREQALTEGSASAVYRFRHRSGAWMWMSDMRRCTVHDGCIEVVGVASDVTREREQAEELAQAGKLAALGEMASGLAHEINRPLASIGLTAENVLALLADDPTDLGAVRQKLERIRTQTMHAAEVVDHIRRFSRRPSGPVGETEIATALNGAIGILQGRLVAARITFRQDLAADLAPVRGHLVLLEQVLLNLVGNAIDAVDAAKPPLEAARRVVSVAATMEGSEVVVTVADHAGGIPEAELGRIFERFFTTKPAGLGTGLGLSISQTIITDMGGSIVAANVGDGATFTVRLPAARPAA